jgi:hypothetical protein
MSTSQHAQLSIVSGLPRPDDFDPAQGGYEPTIGLKAVAKILNCSAEQCRRLAEAKKIPVFRIGYRWKSTASAIVRNLVTLWSSWPSAQVCDVPSWLPSSGAISIGGTCRFIFAGRSFLVVWTM